MGAPLTTHLVLMMPVVRMWILLRLTCGTNPGRVLSGTTEAWMRGLGL